MEALVHPAVLQLCPALSSPHLRLNYKHGVPRNTDENENYKVQTVEYTQHGAAFPMCSQGHTAQVPGALGPCKVHEEAKVNEWIFFKLSFIF